VESVLKAGKNSSVSKVEGLRSKRGAIPKRKALYDKVLKESAAVSIVMKYAKTKDQSLHAVVWTMTKGQVRQALKDIESLTFILNEFNA